MKKLITADKVRECKHNGVSELVAEHNKTIITPEAADVAKVLGIKIVDCAQAGTTPEPVVQCTSDCPAPDVNAADEPLKRIKQEIQSRLSGSADENMVEALIKQALADFQQKAPSCPRQINDDGIVLVRGNSVELGCFDGAPGKDIGLTDVIGPEQNSNMGVGYMGWEKAFFPWTLNYDEVDVVLEGELHIKTPSGTTIGKPGDVLFIPKGSTIEFGTPTHVRFVYISYPADWSAQ